jgi:hypothetical protein
MVDALLSIRRDRKDIRHGQPGQSGIRPAALPLSDKRHLNLSESIWETVTCQA